MYSYYYILVPWSVSSKPVCKLLDDERMCLLKKIINRLSKNVHFWIIDFL